MATKGKARMLAKLQGVTSTAVSQGNAPSDTAGVGDSIGRLNAIEAKATVTMQLSPDAIRKVWNPREIPLTFEETRSVQWPSFETVAENLDKSLSETIENLLAENEEIRNRLVDWTMDDLVHFFHEIHLLSKSIFENHQLQDVIVYRSPENFESFILLAGERRVFSFVYGGATGADMPKIRCLAFNQKPSALSLAVLQDHENTQKSDLKLHELVASKRAIYDAYVQDNKVPTSREAAKLFSYRSNNFAYTLVQLFQREDCDELINLIRLKRMTKRDLMNLISDLKGEGIEQVVSPGNTDTPGSPVAKTEAGKATPKPKKTKSLEEKATASVEKGVEAKSLAATGKQYGFSFGRKVDLSLIDLLLDAALHPRKVTKEHKAIIKECSDTSDPTEKLTKLISLAEALEN